MQSYITKLQEALQKNHSITLSCHCKVHYSGRAESSLDYGDRILIIKADNTLIVHQPTGNNPVNYMKPGNQYTFEEKKGKLHLRADNLPLKESMVIEIKTIYSCETHKLEDSTSISVIGTEKDMNDMIYKEPELLEEGFTPVSQEEQTKHGFIDVFGTDKEGNLCVVECKRYIGDLGAVDQLRRYVERVKESKGIEHVRGILVSPDITPNALKMLQGLGYDHIRVEPPKRYEGYGKNQLKLDYF